MILAGTLTTVQAFLADGGNSPADVDPTTGHGPEWGKAGPIGLLTIVLLCVAVYFLVKSMNRNLRKVPDSFEAAPKVSVTAGGTPSSDAVGPAATSGADAGASPAGPLAGPESPTAGSTSAE